MTNEKKSKLIKYLYPTDEIREFMCNDFYQELLNIIPTKLLISSYNKVNKTRECNLEIVKQKIVEFLKNNSNYTIELAELYKDKEILNRIDDFVTGLTFFVASTNEKYKDIDIFKNKESVCFSVVSIADIL